MNAINFSLVLSSLGKLNKVNFPSFTGGLAVIHEAESTAQWCLSRVGVGKGAGTARTDVSLIIEFKRKKTKNMKLGMHSQW